MNPDSFLGLSKKDAQNLAEQYNLIFRLVSVDSNNLLGYPDTEDVRDDRICVELKKNRVIKASLQ